MEPGDTLVFHRHLMHHSTDNGSDCQSAAMAIDYVICETGDLCGEQWGFTPPNVDWMAVHRIEF